MTDTAATANRSPGFAKKPDYPLEVAAGVERYRVVFNGETVADSHNVLVMRESSYDPVCYFPRQDVRMELLQSTTHGTHCPFKGDASYWSIVAGDRVAESAVWSYQAPFDEVEEIAGHLAFYPDRVDAIEVVEG